MKRLGLITATLLILSGCDRAATPATTADAAQAPAAVPAAPCVQQASGYQWLPAGLVLGIPHHLRADRIYTNKNDMQRRRVVLEFLDGDAESTLASVDQSMTTAGFAARPRRNQPNGNIIVPYVKKGYGSISVVANATAGDNPSNPGARGTIVFDFPIAGPATAAPSQPAH